MKGRVQADYLEVNKALVMLGEGIAWLPDYLTADAVESGELVRVLSQWRPKERLVGDERGRMYDGDPGGSNAPLGGVRPVCARGGARSA